MSKKDVFKRVLLLICFVLVLSPLAAQNNETDSASPQTEIIKGKNGEDIVITQPEFKGGIEKMYKYISDNFEYPEDAQKRSVNGKMEVEFTVEKSGDITYVGILKGLDYSIDDEVLRLLKAMPRWIPATKNGEPVRYKVTMPLTIRASRNKKSSQALSDYREQ